MAQANNKKKLTFSTTKGIAMYPWLNKADYQFDSNGQYKVNLRVSKKDAKSLMDDAKQAANDAFGAKAANAKMPFKTDEETGDVIIVTKSKFKPKFMDSTGSLISENNVPPIYGGSTLKLAGTMYPYTAGGNVGVSLQLAGVQIIELSEGSDNGIQFAAEDGGFVAANDNAPDDAAGAAYNF
jgi:hypothetical protein